MIIRYLDPWGLGSFKGSYKKNLEGLGFRVLGFGLRGVCEGSGDSNIP